jgi:riboflavin synthase
MFTGLVQHLGEVAKMSRESGGGARLAVLAPGFVDGVELGESIAVNGVCLTVVAACSQACTFEVSPETLRRPNLGDLQRGSPANLERALRLSDRLGGHLVQGHVDGLGRLASRTPDGEWEVFWFSCPAELTRQMVPKGSICVDGVSLTLVDVASDRFSVALIPHTLAQTTLGKKAVGSTVNLETDVLAKYVWKCLQGGGVSLAALQQAGFVQPATASSRV